MSADTGRQLVAIIDFGTQYTQLIARRLRELEVYSEVFPYTVSPEELKARNPIGVVFTGGPNSVYEAGAPHCDAGLLDLGVPVLGICYGMQLTAHLTGGKVEAVASREYGRTGLVVDEAGELFHGVDAKSTVWMSHGDSVDSMGADFTAVAHTEGCPLAAVRHNSRPLYGVQFHPEVTHTEAGTQILHNFLYRICKADGDWKTESMVDQAVSAMQAQIGGGGVVCGLSGGVDSAVTAALLHKAIGDQLTCIFVDTGLLRQGERQLVERTFTDAFGLKLITVDAADRFLDQLAGVTDPEEKRKRIGHTFIDVFADEAKSIPGAKFLAQGTLYPDVIESVSPVGGPSHKIKTHHNVGGLPENLPFELVEPLRLAFKDEVRRMGIALGLPEEMVWRHPFPGPGLAVRVLGEVTAERLAVLRPADAIVREELKTNDLHRATAQAFAVLLPVSTVGVMGDARTYESVVAVRAVTTDDFMTADWARLPAEVLATMSSRIINEVKGVNRVVYDISTKPPATIEWE